MSPVLLNVDQVANFGRVKYGCPSFSLYFGFASQAEAVQPFIGADIAEDRFDNGHPVAVDLFAVGAVDAMFHLTAINGKEFMA